jgi:hypothetical protein
MPYFVHGNEAYHLSEPLLDDGIITIGTEGDIAIPEKYKASVLDVHASFVLEGGRWCMVGDICHSGTFVNGKIAGKKAYPLENGDIIKLCDYWLEFIDSEDFPLEVKKLAPNHYP